jgi:hypothetical protein
VSEPKLTQVMTLHLNGGSKFSELHYKILADGAETGITLHERTNGSPNYKYTARELHFGEETLDLMEEGHPKMRAWILEHVPGPRAVEKEFDPDTEDYEFGRGEEGDR